MKAELVWFFRGKRGVKIPAKRAIYAKELILRRKLWMASALHMGQIDVKICCLSHEGFA